MPTQTNDQSPKPAPEKRRLPPPPQHAEQLGALHEGSAHFSEWMPEK